MNRIKKLERELRRLQKLVFYDELTGVLNRRGFKEEAEKAFRVVYPSARHQNRRTPMPVRFCILFTDIDNFKKINDTFGHEVGDKALKRIGAALRKTLRSEDLFGRWGGEEFVIALLWARAAQARMVAERIRRNIGQINLKVKARRVPVTASIGIALHSREKNIFELIQTADKAMYRAKKLGKNRVFEFE